MSLATFVLKSLELAKRPQRAESPFTDEQPEKLWRAIMRSGVFQDRFLTLWFEEEYEARKIPQGAPTIQEIMGVYLAGQQSLKCAQIVQSPAFWEKNIYTGQTERRGAWNVDFVPTSPSQAIQGMSLAYPSPQETKIWSPGLPYNLPQIVAKVNPIHTTGTFTVEIGLVNATVEAFSAANVVSLLTTLSFGGASVSPPSLSFDVQSATLTLTATLRLTDVLTPARTSQGAALEQGTSTITLLQGSGSDNLWDLTTPFGPADMMTAMQPQVVTYPAANYLAEEEATGFFDTFGYHPPGSYPAGNFTGGFIWENGPFGFIGVPNILGTDAVLQSVSAKGVLARIVNGNLNKMIVAGYNAGQTFFQAF